MKVDIPYMDGMGNILEINFSTKLRSRRLEKVNVERDFGVSWWLPPWKFNIDPEFFGHPNKEKDRLPFPPFFRERNSQLNFSNGVTVVLGELVC